MFYHWCRWFVPWAEARLDSPIVGALRRVFPFPTHGRGMESDILDTFDGYSPRFHGIHSPEEVESWFKEAGLEDVRRPSNWNTCVRGQKPLNRNASSLTQHRVSIENEGATPVNLQPRDNSALSADVDYAIQVATYYLQHMDEMGTSLAKSQILELGPGINFGPQLILASHGAQVTLADRFLAPWDETYHPHFYRLLRSRWDGKSSVLDKVIDAGEYPIGSLTLLSEPAERLHSVANGTFDLVISNAVLEHVYDLPAVCQELARVTKIGGANSHQIDFRYHADFSQPLEFLLYAENDFRKKFAIEMGQIGNRWRPSEADALFRRHGFSITRIINNGFTEAHYLAGFIPRLRKSRSHYRKWPEKDLTVVSARYVLTRVQSYPLIFRGEVDFLTGQYRKLFWRFGG
jgi:SAM-dependent methyltransferase